MLPARAHSAPSPSASDASGALSTNARSAAPTPPRVLHSVEAVYPQSAWDARREGRVELLVTVLRDGEIGDVVVSQSGGQAFDEAAIAAMRQWRLEPATQNEQPIDSRIRVPFQFVLPATLPPPAPSSSLVEAQAAGAQAAEVQAAEAQAAEVQAAEVQAAEAQAAEAQAAEAQAVEAQDAELQGIESSLEEPAVAVTVRGRRRPGADSHSASDFHIQRDVLAAAPRSEGAEVLRSAPGVYIGRAAGLAVAHTYMLRGFDAEHGQDIEFRVGGLPINLPSHIHGQGYSDLGFLVGDAVQELRVTEGVYNPRQGDFAIAGSIELKLGVKAPERGIHMRSGYGSWDTSRQLVLWAPRDAPEETFGAVQYMKTNGFGENRAGQSGSGIFQHRFGRGALTFRSIGIIHAARSDLAGVVRRDDVDAGLVCFTCAYPHPTAQRQNALTNRLLLGLFADYKGSGGARGQMGVWLGHDNFRLQKNFTGFLQRSRTLERVGGRGDLIEQQNRTFSMGLSSRYRAPRVRLAPWAHGTLEVGAEGRLDLIDQAQALLDASVRNQTWDRRVDASIRGLDLGLWEEFDWRFTRYMRVRAGFRADLLSYDIEERLGNFVPLTRPQESFIPGFRRSALGLAWGPRASVELRPLGWLSLLAAYGEGYRSPQARLLEDGERAPFSKVNSTDAGLRFDWGDPLRLTLSGFYTKLSDDIAFDAGEGRLERVGATQRVGAVAHAVTRPLHWLVGSLSFTFVDATLLEPPPPSAEEPQPPFTPGQSLPFVPPIVVRSDLGTRHTFVESLGGYAFGGRTGLGFSFLSPRPLPYGGFADPVSLLDLSMGLSWGAAELTFELFNALNARYAVLEYSFASDWDPNNGVRPRTPARHTSAGAPLSWMLSLGVTL